MGTIDLQIWIHLSKIDKSRASAHGYLLVFTIIQPIDINSFEVSRVNELNGKSITMRDYTDI